MHESSDDYLLIIFQETAMAYLVGYAVEDIDDAVWIPKSRISVSSVKSKTKEGYEIREFTIPDWLAEKKDLV
jgi:hypothetical protein